MEVALVLLPCTKHCQNDDRTKSGSCRKRATEVTAVNAEASGHLQNVDLELEIVNEDNVVRRFCSALETPVTLHVPFEVAFGDNVRINNQTRPSISICIFQVLVVADWEESCSGPLDNANQQKLRRRLLSSDLSQEQCGPEVCRGLEGTVAFVSEPRKPFTVPQFLSVPYSSPRLPVVHHLSLDCETSEPWLRILRFCTG